MNERKQAILILCASVFVLLVLLMIMSGCAVARPPLEQGTEPVRGGRALLVVCFFSSCRDIGVPREQDPNCVPP